LRGAKLRKIGNVNAMFSFPVNDDDDDDKTESESDSSSSSDYDFPLLRLAKNARPIDAGIHDVLSPMADHGRAKDKETDAPIRTKLHELEVREATAIKQLQDSDVELEHTKRNGTACHTWDCQMTRAHIECAHNHYIDNQRRVRMASMDVRDEKHRLVVEKLEEDKNRLEAESQSLLDLLVAKRAEIAKLKESNLKLETENDELWDDMHKSAIQKDIDYMQICYGPRAGAEKNDVLLDIDIKKTELNSAKDLLNTLQIAAAKSRRYLKVMAEQTVETTEAETRLVMAQGKLTEPHLGLPLCADSKRFIRTIATLMHKLHEHRVAINRPYTEDDPDVFQHCLYELHKDLGVVCDNTDMSNIVGRELAE